MAIASINSIIESAIAYFNGVAKVNIGTIDGEAFPVDSISLSAGALYYDTYGVAYVDDYVTVTSSGNWSASILNDTYNIIDSFTNSGASGDPLYVSLLNNSTITDCHTATITVTKGTASEDLIIYQDGTVLTC